MRAIAVQVVVPTNPGEAFPWVVEPGLLREWLPQLEELRPRGFLHHRPVVRHGALRFALDVRVVRVVVPEVLELAVTWRGAVGRSQLDVEDHDDGALVTWTVELALPPGLRLAGPGVARELRRTMGRALERLAALLGEPASDVAGAAADADPPPGDGPARPGDEGAPGAGALGPGNPGPGTVGGPSAPGPGGPAVGDHDGAGPVGRVG